MPEFGPAFKSVTWTSSVTTSGGLPVSMPATVHVGDTLMACVGALGSAAAPAGWTYRGQVDDGSGAIRWNSYDRVADGTEGGTTVTFPKSGAHGAGVAFLAGVVRLHFPQTYSVTRGYNNASSTNPFDHYTTYWENLGTMHELIVSFLAGSPSTGYSHDGAGTLRGDVSGEPWTESLFAESPSGNWPVTLTLVTFDDITGDGLIDYTPPDTGVTNPNMLFTGGVGTVGVQWVGWALRDGDAFDSGDPTSDGPTAKMRARRVDVRELPYQVSSQMLGR